VAYGRINAAECCFVHEAERAEVFKPGGARTKLEGSSSLADLLQVWSRRIERLAAEFAEEYGRLFEALREEDVRRIAVLKLEGYTVDEIAAQLGCARRTVARRLELIRSLWRRMAR